MFNCKAFHSFCEIFLALSSISKVSCMYLTLVEILWNFYTFLFVPGRYILFQLCDKHSVKYFTAFFSFMRVRVRTGMYRNGRSPNRYGGSQSQFSLVTFINEKKVVKYFTEEYLRKDNSWRRPFGYRQLSTLWWLALIWRQYLLLCRSCGPAGSLSVTR